MIKKKLGLLAASVLVASGAQAAISAGSAATNTNTCGGYACFDGTGVDSDVVFWATDTTDANGSFFVNLTALAGVTVDSLLAGNGFSFDLAGTGINLGLYDAWGVSASSHDMSTTYGYGKNGVAVGAITANNGTPPGSLGGNEGDAENRANEIDFWFGQIAADLGGADFGAVGTGDASDWNNTGSRTVAPGTTPNAIGGVADLWLSGILDTTPEPVYTPGPSDTTVQNNQLTGAGSLVLGGIGANGAGPTTLSFIVPVPAAAWLFGSALLGLGAARRRS